MFDAFNHQKISLTRTQQIIILALTLNKTLTMSQLTEKINTSNEQATRAVAQLVDKNFIQRYQDKSNRRIINISLTEDANKLLAEAKSSIQSEILKRFDSISDEDMHNLYEALLQITKILKK